MKNNVWRLTLGVLILSTLILASLVVFRRVTRSRSAQPSKELAQHHIDLATQIAAELSKIKTRPLSLEEYGRIIRTREIAGSPVLTERERLKLFACIDRFYACYSSGAYDDFKRFRLQPPFIISDGLSSVIKGMASKEGVALKSGDDILRYAWEHYNKENKITQVGDDSVVLSVVDRRDTGTDLRRFSIAKFPETGASCWEGSVVYKPNPAELLQAKGALRFFVLQQFVRLNGLVDGPATPMMLIGYWDPTREDWMPLALCTMLQVGNYDTIL